MLLAGRFCAFLSHIPEGWIAEKFRTLYLASNLVLKYVYTGHIEADEAQRNLMKQNFERCWVLLRQTLFGSKATGLGRKSGSRIPAGDLAIFGLASLRKEDPADWLRVAHTF